MQKECRNNVSIHTEKIVRLKCHGGDHSKWSNLSLCCPSSVLQSSIPVTSTYEKVDSLVTLLAPSWIHFLAPKTRPQLLSNATDHEAIIVATMKLHKCNGIIWTTVRSGITILSYILAASGNTAATCLSPDTHAHRVYNVEGAQGSV